MPADDTPSTALTGKITGSNCLDALLRGRIYPYLDSRLNR